MSEVRIIFDRDSVCMGDDADSHQKEIVINSNILLSEFITMLIKSVPSMYNCVWSVTSNTNVIGYIITDENGHSTVDVCGEDKSVGSSNIERVFCTHYYDNYFTKKDPETGKKIDEYPECQTLLQKVKKRLEKK